ncbi:MAG: hypothetical protein Q9168_000172 [Polycauliona sp. 1 TL-2023]
MAITRSHKPTRASSPKFNHTHVPSHKPLPNSLGPHQRPGATKLKRKNGLTKELTALGIVPKPEKKAYDGPGERGDVSRFTGQGTECTICAESQAQREFPETAILSPCDHPSTICRTCIARHTETQLAGDGKWRNVQCLQCHTKQTKAQICKLVWKEDFKG